MKFTNQLLFIDQVSCKDICVIDATAISSSKDYASANEFGYFTLINVWSNLAAEFAFENGYNLVQAIKRDGLIKVIKRCQDLSDVIVSEMNKQSDSDTHYVVAIPTEALFLVQGCGSINDILFLLRFPKRFSPLKADLVEKQSISDFLSVNNEVKMKQHYERPYYIVKRIRAVIEDMCRFYRFDINDGYFSSGAFVARPGYPNSNTLANKIISWEDCNWFGQVQFPSYSLSEQRRGDLFYSSELKAVPKKYNSARIIAKENSYRQYYMQAVRAGLERSIIETGYDQYVDFSDQGMNQYLCFLGSCSDAYCTIDLSAASDRLSCDLVRSVFPPRVLTDMDEYRSRYFSLNERRYPTQMYLTSGAALTFVTESMVFLAICLAATHYVEVMTDTILSKPRVYGDDCLVDPLAYDTVTEWMELLGLKVNPEKSFTLPGRYRESCGVEFLDGLELTQSYWPRTTISTDATSISSLIALEKRLYDKWRARTFLVEVVRSVVPHMTSSEVLSENDDLWEPYPLNQERFLVSDEPLSRRERHLSLLSSYKTSTVSPDTLDALDMYYYMSYLQFGPQYDSKLDEMLGTSTSRRNTKRDTNRPTMKWGYRLV